MSRKSDNISFFKNRRFHNIGMFLFFIILIYVCVCFYLGLQNEQIVGYQVKAGVLSENRQYTGIALREEHCVNSQDSGYINYLIRENERVGYNNLVYCIDETGKISDLISKDPTQDNSLSSEELNSIKQDIISFTRSFDETCFSDATIFTNKLNNTIHQIENRKILDNMSNLNSLHVNDIVDYCKAKSTGIVLFYQDGYENFIASDLNPDDFNVEKYERKTILNDDLVTEGDFAYKYINNENWSIAICVPNEDSYRILKNEYVEVKFLDDAVSSWAKVSFVNSYEESTLIELSFTNSMVSYAKDRFIKVELVLEEDEGLKIPISSIVEKEFYLIDSDFVFKDPETSDYYVIRNELDSEGNTTKKVYITVLKEDTEENVCYVDKTSITYGAALLKEYAPVGASVTETFVVGGLRVGTLPGVYCINKGYCDFKRIIIKYQDDEYAIISNNASFGLREYDYIALDADKVTDKDFVY